MSTFTRLLALLPLLWVEAGWAVTYSVTISAGPNGDVSPSGIVTVNRGSTVTYSAAADTGFYVQSWGGGPASNCAVDTYQVNSTVNGASTNITFLSTAILGECELSVGFQAIPVTAKPSASAGGSVSPSTNQTETYGSTIDFVLSPDAGYRIDRVEGTCPGSLSGDTYSAGPLVENCTVLAYFAALPTFTVTPSAGTGGTIAPSTAQSVTESDTASFTLTPDSGYQTDSVSGTCGGTLSVNTFTTSPITADCTVVGNFAEVVTLSYDLQGGSTGPSNQTGAAGADINISSSTPIREGYTFAGWNTAADGSGTSYSSGDSFTLPNSGTVTLYAVWNIKSFTVSPSAGSGGTISPSSNQTAEFNTTVTFTATPNQNYELTSFGGTCGGQRAANRFTTDPVTSNCTVSASFNLISGTVEPPAPSLSLTSFSETSAQLSIRPNGVGSDPITSYTASCEIPSRARVGKTVLSRSGAVALGTPSLSRRSGLPEGGPFGAADRSAGLIYDPNPQLRSLQSDDLVTFITPDGKQYSVPISKAELTRNQNLEVYGQDGDVTIHAVITETGDFFGSIETDGDRYQAIIAGGNTLVYSSADDGIAQNPFLNDMDLERLAEQQNFSSAELQVTEASNDTTTITVGILYDNAIRDNINYSAMVDAYVGYANQAYQNSGVNIEFQVVAMGNYEPYISYTNMHATLSSITCNSISCDPLSGVNPAVNSWRDSVKADLVAQFVFWGTTSGTCGIAQLPWDAGNIVNRDNLKQYTYSVNALYLPLSQYGYPACGDYVLAHEMGHNFGLWHDRDTLADQGWTGTPSPVLSYAHGHKLDGVFGTVMSYSSSRIRNLSNPNLAYSGYPIGVPIGQSGEAFAAQAAANTMAYHAAIYDNNPKVYHTVTGTAGVGGSISPTSVSVEEGLTTSFVVTPDVNYSIASVTGCGAGILSGNTYTTGPLQANCTVTATFHQYRWNKTQSGTSISFNALPTGQDFNCSAVAKNLAGDSPSSNVVSFRTRAPSAPSQPVITKSDYDNGEIYLHVTANDGGSPITGYTATCTDGTNTYTGTSTSSQITVSGLTNDVAYTCTVTATNSVGTSSASAATDPLTPESSATGLPLWLLYQATQ